MGRMGQGVAVVAVVVTLMTASHAVAREQLATSVHMAQPAGVLVMPFDVTAGNASFAIVSRIGAAVGALPLHTHWVFWAADCRHLADVFIELTELDSVVVDPTHLQGQTQSLNPPANEPVGPTVDLSGERGVVTVTALDAARAVVPQLIGGWTIASTTTATSFGGDAVGVSLAGELPDPTLLDGGITIQTFNPQSLTASEVILIGLESDGGSVRPITRASDALGGAHVCCAATVTDNLEITTSVPDVCFDCVAFAPIAPGIAADDETALVPVDLGSSGFVRLDDCRSGTLDGSVTAIGRGDRPQFLIAIHGQAVGPFGVVVTGKYSTAFAL